MNRTTVFLMMLIMVILGFTTVASFSYIYKMENTPNVTVRRSVDSLHFYFDERLDSGRQKMLVVDDSSLTTKHECYLELIKDSIFKNNTYVLDSVLRIKTYDRFVAIYKKNEMIKILHFSVDNPKEGLKFKALSEN